MKRLIPFGLVFVAGLAVAALFLNSRLASRSGSDLEIQRAAWISEKAELEAALQKFRDQRAESSPQFTTSAPSPAALAGTELDPRELLNQLVKLPVKPGQARTLRPVLVKLEQLAQLGQPALPVISQFLASGQEVAYVSPDAKGSRDVQALMDALVPPSLRFGLFDVVRQIGGVEAETILVETLSGTGQGLEVAYLAQMLESMAPGKYREATIAAAHNLLANGNEADRKTLFGLLRHMGDASYAAAAQAQLIQADGQVDRSALRYLQQTLGDKSIALAAQLYQDGRLAEPGSKEPLARLALAYVGANDQALDLFHSAVTDPALLPDQKRNLVEDLNQDGFINRKNPTAEDLKIMANRYELTQTYLQQPYVQNDAVLLRAFREADKDLLKMLQKAAAAAANPVPTK
jgi:hypothetical protein